MSTGDGMLRGGRRRSLLGVVVTSSVMVGGLAVAPSAGAATGDTLVADWELNEPAGSTVMTDSSGNHLDGTISPDAAANGLTLDGSVYTWSLRSPTAPPPQLPRVVQVVPESDKLDIPDPNVTQTITFRFKTSKPYGNIMQKGQATDAGGQIKIENPGGYTQCVYHGGNGSYVAVASPIKLNDNKWHTFSCVHMAKQIQVWVDGAQVAQKNVSTGYINNAYPFVVGGKSRCDQVKVTCDYYSGQIDWIRIYNSTGSAPLAAAFTSSCGGLACSFDGSTSTGAVTSYSWSFGDGSARGSGPTPSHTYAAAGTYPVKLTVTDASGKTSSVTHEVSVTTTLPKSISYVGQAAQNANARSWSVTVPAAVVSGDGLVLVQSFNNSATVTGPAGWKLVESVKAGSETTTVWQRVASASDARSKVTVSASTAVKGDLKLLAYHGTSSAGPIAAALGIAETVSRTAHTTPTATAGAAGTWVLSLWADKSSGTTTIVPPAGVARRHFQCTGGGGEICALSADSNGPVSQGARVGGLTATADVASRSHTMWTILLAPGG